MLGWSPVVFETVRLPAAVTPVNAIWTWIQLLPVPRSQFTVDAPVATGRCRLPSTKPLVRLTLPLAISVFAPVVIAPAVKVSVPLTVELPDAPLKLRPLPLTVRPEKLGVVPVIVCADDPLNVAVPPVLVNV